jgi:SAM-dependent methyltransferase
MAFSHQLPSVAMQDQPKPLTYNPEIFDVGNIEAARRIILTGEGSTTDERWESETPYLADAIQNSLKITADTILIDYGCGIGRMAKELIQRHGCRVIGVDTSNNMRILAPNYVQSSRFLACSPEMLDMLVARNFVADAAISIWVLQHCLRPTEDIDRIHRSLAPGGGLFVLNNLYRAVPTRERHWVNDGLDIKSLLCNRFSMVMEGKPTEDKTPRDLRDIIFWANFLKSG